MDVLEQFLFLLDCVRQRQATPGQRMHTAGLTEAFEQARGATAQEQYIELQRVARNMLHYFIEAVRTVDAAPGIDGDGHQVVRLRARVDHIVDQLG